MTLVTAPGTKRTHLAQPERNDFGQYVALCHGIADHKLYSVSALEGMGYRPATTVTCPSCSKLAELDTFAVAARQLGVEL